MLFALFSVVKAYSVIVVAAVFLFTGALGADAQDRIWDGGGPDVNWSTTTNWNPDGVPLSTERAVFNTSSLKSCTINTTLNVAGIQISAGYTGTISQNGFPITLGSSGFSQADGTFLGSGTGSIAREWWTGIGGGAVTDLTNSANYPGNPTARDLPTTFQAPIDWADNYGTRMRGWFVPDQTGDWFLRVSGDDNSELYLSTDADPANKVLISRVATFTGSLAWTNGNIVNSNQPRSLVAGQRYYIEAIQKEAAGLDNLAVRAQFNSNTWVDGTAAIAGTQLAPYADIVVNGSFALSGGAFTSTTGRLEVSGAFTHSAGSFSHNSGRVILKSAADRTLTVISGTQFQNLDINSGLVGYWKLDEGSGEITSDGSGYGNAGRRNNMESADWIAGTPSARFTNNSALDFGGTNEFVAMEVQGLPAANTSQTLSLWFYYTTSPGATTMDLLSLGNQGSTSAVKVGFRGSELQVWNFGGTKFVGTGSIPSINNWHHVLYTLDGATTTHTLYLDGTAQPTSTIAPNTATPNELDLGRWLAGTEYFVGRIDDVRIYNRALSAAEVGRLAGGYQPDVASAVQTLSGPSLNVRGNLALGAGTLVTSANPITVGGSWMNHGGVFTGTGTVTFDGTRSSNRILPGGQSFSDVTVNSNAATNLWSLESAFTVAGTLTLTAGTLQQTAWLLDAAGVSLSASGNWKNLSTGDITIGAGNVANAGTIALDGGGAG